MIETLRSLIPEFSHFEELEIQDQSGTAGYHSTLILKSGFPFAGGTHSEKAVARRICAAEAIERAHVRKERERASEALDPFLLREFSTSCGFAAGFERSSTIFRAICETVERWCWSKWIDENRAPSQTHVFPINPLSLYFSQFFDSIHWFRLFVRISGKALPAFIPTELVFSAVIGATKSGIFPGSRVSTKDDDLVTHPLLEAWRHRTIFENELRDKTPVDIIDQRIKYFGQHGETTLKDLLKQTESPTVPALACEIRLLRQVASSDQYEVWRALADSYIPWQLGDEKRFIY